MNAQPPSEQAPPPLSPLLTVRQAGSLTQLSERTIYRAMTSGQLRSLKIGRSRRISTRALADWVDDYPTTIREFERRRNAREGLN